MGGDLIEIGYSSQYHLTTGTMVGAEAMAQISSTELHYENIKLKENMETKSDVNCNHKIQQDDIYTPEQDKRDCVSSTTMSDEENVQDGENIYEIIPSDCTQQKFDNSTMTRSLSFECAAHKTNEKWTLESSEAKHISVSWLQYSSPLVTHSNPDISTTHYAEIIHTNKVSDFVPSRPTRDSENPILRQDFSGNLSFLPNLRNLRKHLTDISQERCLEREQRSAKRSLTPECPRKPNDAVSGQVLSKSVSPRHSPMPSPRVSNPPAPIYANVECLVAENHVDNESRRSSGSSRSSVSFNEGQSLSSTEDTSFREADVSYENVRDLLECFKLKEKSSPVDIVYSDLHFHNEARASLPRSLKLNLGKTDPVTVKSLNKKLTVHENSCTLPPQPSPKLPPRDNAVKNPRPNSKSLDRLNGGALGFYSARLVKRTIVQRSNAKTLQTTIHDLVSKTKVEDCSSVNIEVTSEMMRISTNCSPWEVIASFDIDNIGCVDLYEHDTSTLGVIVCVPDTDAHCYVIQCQEAQLIFKSVKNAFNSSDSKVRTVYLLYSSYKLSVAKICSCLL